MSNCSFEMPQQYREMFSEVLQSKFEEIERVAYDLSSVLSRLLLNLKNSIPIPKGGLRAW